MTQRTALLDVNVLVALAWPNHAHHAAAHRWFDGKGRTTWATTPFTESGFVRVSSNRSAIPNATSPFLALELLTAMTGLDGHEFWVDDVAMVTAGQGDATAIRTHRDVTDAHLLALAERYEGALVTFDKHLPRLLGARPAELISVLP